MPPWRTWLLKSQYGHFDRQNGQWMYTPNGGASAALKAGLRQLEERARAMRQALALRRQAVLVVAGHLAERLRQAVGEEHRIVAEPLGTARRPHQRAVDRRLELLDVPVRPGDAQ